MTRADGHSFAEKVQSLSPIEPTAFVCSRMVQGLCWWVGRALAYDTGPVELVKYMLTLAGK